MIMVCVESDVAGNKVEPLTGEILCQTFLIDGLTA